MSKIAKKPIEIKTGVNIAIDNNHVSVSGPKGNLNFDIPSGIKAEVKEGNIIISQSKENDEKTKALFGLTRAILANLVKGVTDGFEKKLELSGVGYRAQSSGDSLTLSLGFSHPVIVKGEQGITFNVEENIITVLGTDKVLVGNTAAKIRQQRPPEPYKGKGIKYVGERIRRKAGKAAKAVAGAK
ncbi:MAG: 50S ribosomal protein L6 [Candidatus Levybacteria bacterium CG10_big_fil_rev_8_21_14_0_10_35_13]|nr:MAG: 50S ribosomal protein L6 [Candidatus Levybacteria bacterium CG10_big_fil_rev_8_21_14_0_10_35_13]